SCGVTFSPRRVKPNTQPSRSAGPIGSLTRSRNHAEEHSSASHESFQPASVVDKVMVPAHFASVADHVIVTRGAATGPARRLTAATTITQVRHGDAAILEASRKSVSNSSASGMAVHCPPMQGVAFGHRADHRAYIDGP